MAQTLVIDRRFRGPERSGNGGWSAGLVAAPLGDRAEVTLRIPPPLDVPLDLRHDGDGTTLHHGDVLVAEGALPDGDLAPPPRAVRLDESLAATTAYRGFDSHAFRGCFTCGTDRADGDGLRIFPGPVEPGLVAAPWTPHPSIADGDGTISGPAVWAALDCPSGWAGELSADQPAVLGRLAVDVRRRPLVGEQLVVVGWAVEDLPKKFIAASALLADDGEVLAVARATWVRIPLDWRG